MAAAELVGARLVAGQREEARIPAEAIAAHENENYRALAARALGSDDPVWDSIDTPGDAAALVDLRRLKIVHGKSRAHRDPRNPVAWADLARHYTCLGQFGPAAKALRIARALAPDSRYLLRISTRFYVHIGEAEKAVRLLRASPRTREDPWLMAAHLSSASLAGEPLPGARVAHRIIGSGRFKPIESSDLVSELGTLDLKAGADRRARKLFLESLGNPTDNSLAQVEWASHKMSSLSLTVSSFDVPFPAEAKARDLAQRGEWKGALAETLRWLFDQPFDAAAAAQASYVAAVGLDDWGQSRSLAAIGLQSSPNDATLANNAAYASIELGDLAAAAQSLKFASEKASVASERVAVVATAGLLQFRLGYPEGGTRLYNHAIELARRLGNNDGEAMARSMLMREQVRLGDVTTATAGLSHLIKLVPRVEDAGVARCVERSRVLVAGNVDAIESPVPSGRG